MKYKIGDKVWIRSNISIGMQPDRFYYEINEGESDIRGLEVEIIEFNTHSKNYSCKEYKYFSEGMIDEEKTNQNKIYEIY